MLQTFKGNAREPLETTETAPHDFFPFGDGVLFSSGVNPGSGGWHSTGTRAGTGLLAPVHPGPSNWMDNLFLSMGGRVYFGAASSGNILKLWQTDGTRAGTHLFLNRNVGGALVRTRNHFYFQSYDDTGQNSIWISDGTAAGSRSTAQYTTGTAGWGVGSSFTATGKALYLIAQIDGPRDRLWTLPVG